MIKIKTIHQIPEKEDGYRILVDNSWPEDISEEKDLKIDLWLKEIAPSSELHNWFDQDPLKWSEFKQRYQDELRNKKTLISIIRDIEKDNNSITFVHGSEIDDQNGAVILRDKLQGYKTIRTYTSRILG